MMLVGFLNIIFFYYLICTLISPLDKKRISVNAYTPALCTSSDWQ